MSITVVPQLNNNLIKSSFIILMILDSYLNMLTNIMREVYLAKPKSIQIIFFLLIQDLKEPDEEVEASN